MSDAHAAMRNVLMGPDTVGTRQEFHAGGRPPGHEPGSSIMPGKVNPTQCEALVTIAIQDIGEDSAVAFAGSQGCFELDAMRPIIMNKVLHMTGILADGAENAATFDRVCDPNTMAGEGLAGA